MVGENLRRWFMMGMGRLTMQFTKEYGSGSGYNGYNLTYVFTATVNRSGTENVTTTRYIPKYLVQAYSSGPYSIYTGKS